MAFSRYKSDRLLNLGTQYGTTTSILAVRNAVKFGIIPIVDIITVKENQRLDHLSAIYYTDARYWWVLAAASDIGWGLQVPAGTVITIPDLDAVSAIIG